MPTYNYKCKSCGYEFERFSSISSYSKKLDCPVCQDEAVITISGGSGLIFKGTGFYITDYRNKSKADSGNGKSNGSNNGKKEKSKNE